MKPRTFGLLKKLANQRLNMLQQKMVRRQNEREVWQQRIDELRRKSLEERATADVMADAYFQKLAAQKKEYEAEILRLDEEITDLQKQVIEAWQKEEILKTLPYGSK